MTAPIIDLRQRLSWRQQWPTTLGTSALWLGSLCLLGPVKLTGLVVAGVLAMPTAALLERGRRQHAPLKTQAQQAHLSGGLSRAAVARQLGIQESQLFRARHASVCIVHHDAAGCIVTLEIPQLRHQSEPSSTDAHPVG